MVNSLLPYCWTFFVRLLVCHRSAEADPGVKIFSRSPFERHKCAAVKTNLGFSLFCFLESVCWNTLLENQLFGMSRPSISVSAQGRTLDKIMKTIYFYFWIITQVDCSLWRQQWKTKFCKMVYIIVRQHSTDRVTALKWSEVQKSNWLS